MALNWYVRRKSRSGRTVLEARRRAVEHRSTMARTREAKPPNANAASNRADVGFEATLWVAADKLRGHMGGAEYKRDMICLVFLKYITFCRNGVSQLSFN